MRVVSSAANLNFRIAEEPAPHVLTHRVAERTKNDAGQEMDFTDAARAWAADDQRAAAAAAALSQRAGGQQV
jgi:negative regulator of sigma E activity